VTQFILRNDQVRKNYENFYANLPAHKVWSISVKEEKKDLTRQQRNFFHLCVGVICQFNGDKPSAMKLRIKYSVLDLEEVITGEGKKYLAPPSTEDLTREQYSQLIEATLALGQSLGLTMPSAGYFGYEGI